MNPVSTVTAILNLNVFIKSLFNGNEITATLAIRQLYFDKLRGRMGEMMGFKGDI